MELDISCDVNINTIKELLLDEEKLITYVSLSKDLCIHVNQSKTLLRRTAEIIQNEQPNLQLNISYIVSGLLEGNNARVIVCPQEDLTSTRKKFTKIFFEHIYSVSRGIASIKNSSILLHNKFDDFVLCKGFIKSSECNKYKQGEINNLRDQTQDSNPKITETTTPPILKIKQELQLTSSEKEVKKVVVNARNKENKTSPEIKIEGTAKSDVVPKVNSNQKTNNPNLKSQKGIVNFFAKSINNQKSTEFKINGIQHKEVKDIKVEKNDTPMCQSDEELEIVKKEMTTNNEINSNKEIKKANKDTAVLNNPKDTNISSQSNLKNNKAKKPSKVDKNRKRVLQLSDSDSEEENDPFANKNNVIDDSDDEIPPTPMANNIKITSGLVNPKKKRKIIDKTFMDEEGYILTKKVEVYESCSDNEDNTKVEDSNIIIPKIEKKMLTSPIKKKVKKQSKKNISPPKGKQSTLTNFFKPK